MPFLGKPHNAAEHFSFAPCRRAATGKDAWFERPIIDSLFDELRLISVDGPPSAASARAISQCRTCDGMSLNTFWDRLTALLWDQELLLGVSFKLPQIQVLGSNSAPAPGCDARKMPRGTRSRAA